MAKYRVTLIFTPHLIDQAASKPQRIQVPASTAAAAAHVALTQWMATASDDEQRSLTDVVVSELPNQKDPLVRFVDRSRRR